MASIQPTGLSPVINVQNTSAPATTLPNCPVSPLDRVTFTPNDISELAPVISGTVFQALDTNLGNWRVRIVREGGLFPHGVSANVYSNLGTFKVHGALNPDAQPAIA